AIVALIVLAGGLTGLELGPGETFPMRLLLPGEAGGSASPGVLSTLLAPSYGLWIILAVGLFVSMILLWIIVFILRPEARRWMATRFISYFILLLLLTLLFNFVQRSLLADQAEAGQADTPGLFDLLGEGEEVPLAPAFISNPPWWLAATITLTLLALLLGLAWFLWQHRPQGQTGPVERMVQEAQHAVEQIRRGSDLKDTIKRCYHDMNLVLSEQRGIQRQTAMTPREFELYLGQIGLKDEHIRQLTRLFERVRYGATTPGEREEREAVACLTAIIETYGRSA
ncbi:MAG TPA: DUF4129 domain-containing protein, partial [Anaerolineae bacterium]